MWAATHWTHRHARHLAWLTYMYRCSKLQVYRLTITCITGWCSVEYKFSCLFGAFSRVLHIPDRCETCARLSYPYPMALSVLQNSCSLSRGTGIHVQKIPGCGHVSLWILHTLPDKLCNLCNTFIPTPDGFVSSNSFPKPAITVPEVRVNPC